MPYKNCSDSFSPSDSSSVQHWPLMSCGHKHCEKAITVEWKQDPASLYLFLISHSFSRLPVQPPVQGLQNTSLYSISKRKTERLYLFPKGRIFSEFNLQKNSQMRTERDALIKISLLCKNNHASCHFQQRLSPKDSCCINTLSISFLSS